MALITAISVIVGTMMPVKQVNADENDVNQIQTSQNEALIKERVENGTPNEKVKPENEVTTQETSKDQEISQSQEKVQMKEPSQTQAEVQKQEITQTQDALQNAASNQQGMVANEASTLEKNQNEEKVENEKATEKTSENSSKKVVEVLSINDLHGNILENGKNIGGAKLAGIIQEYQEKDKASDTYGVVTVSGGDNYQGTAISNILKGAPINDMLKEIGIVASAIGNHEYDWGTDKIKPWADSAGFKFLAANIEEEATGATPSYAEPYLITEVDGVKIGFIGITTPETLNTTSRENVKGLNFLDPVDAINKYSEEVRNNGADIVVALTHTGSVEESDGTITGEAADIAKYANGIDAVISAHTHEFVDGFVKNCNGKDIPVVQAGS
ncbi:MAG: metallophosphatase, partial [Streptococcus gallolyticus]|nr:metallophosphatase [Streptococcus gallolyticus]